MNTGQTVSISDYRAALQVRPGTTTARRKIKRNSPEEDLQRSCVEWVELHKARYPMLEWMMHVPNGGKRSKGEAGKMKGMGVNNGFPDLSVPLPHNGWSGFAAELKSPAGVLSSDQKDWLEILKEKGYVTLVVRTLDEFIAGIHTYLNQKRHLL